MTMHEAIIKPRYAETDRMGVIHHAVYPIYYEAARVEFCEQIGLPYPQIEEMGLMQALKEMRCEYLAPAYFGDVLRVRIRILELTKVKITFAYEIVNQEEVLIHKAETMLVWLDSTFKICNIEKEFPKVYQTLKQSL